MMLRSTARTGKRLKRTKTGWRASDAEEPLGQKIGDDPALAFVLSGHSHRNGTNWATQTD